jgi:hypothetical protein
MPKCSYKHRHGLEDGISLQLCIADGSGANGSRAGDLLHIGRGRNSTKPNCAYRHQYSAVPGSIVPNSTCLGILLSGLKKSLQCLENGC